MAWLPHERDYIDALLGMVNRMSAPLPPLEGLAERIQAVLDDPERGVDNYNANRVQMSRGADPSVRWVRRDLPRHQRPA